MTYNWKQLLQVCLQQNYETTKHSTELNLQKSVNQMDSTLQLIMECWQQYLWYLQHNVTPPSECWYSAFCLHSFTMLICFVSENQKSINPNSNQMFLVPTPINFPKLKLTHNFFSNAAGRRTNRLERSQNITALPGGNNNVTLFTLYHTAHQCDFR